MGSGPGSFIEVRKILPLLVQSSPQFPAFHVVALSLPGFGFSEGAHKPGFAAEQYAEVSFAWFISRLGLDTFHFRLPINSCLALVTMNTVSLFRIIRKKYSYAYICSSYTRRRLGLCCQFIFSYMIIWSYQTLDNANYCS